MRKRGIEDERAFDEEAERKPRCPISLILSAMTERNDLNDQLFGQACLRSREVLPVSAFFFRGGDNLIAKPGPRSIGAVEFFV